jgi:hypothetical protein
VFQDVNIMKSSISILEETVKKLESKMENMHEESIAQIKKTVQHINNLSMQKINSNFDKKIEEIEVKRAAQAQTDLLNYNTSNTASLELMFAKFSMDIKKDFSGNTQDMAIRIEDINMKLEKKIEGIEKAVPSLQGTSPTGQNSNMVTRSKLRESIGDTNMNDSVNIDESSENYTIHLADEEYNITGANNKENHNNV